MHNSFVSLVKSFFSISLLDKEIQLISEMLTLSNISPKKPTFIDTLSMQTIVGICNCDLVSFCLIK